MKADSAPLCTPTRRQGESRKANNVSPCIEKTNQMTFYIYMTNSIVIFLCIITTLYTQNVRIRVHCTEGCMKSYLLGVIVVPQWESGRWNGLRQLCVQWSFEAGKRSSVCASLVAIWFAFICGHSQRSTHWPSFTIQHSVLVSAQTKLFHKGQVFYSNSGSKEIPCVVSLIFFSVNTKLHTRKFRCVLCLVWKHTD